MTILFSRTALRLPIARAARVALALAAAGALAACQESGEQFHNARAYAPIPENMLALMKDKDTDAHAPILIRSYKKEAELEIWKMNHAGKYVHLKTYPMCRWSGQLGPKTREGDRQVPEGFYAITPGQMNPNSAYYLSFNVGYPNAYDRAHNYTGGSIMVHGICSSAGCFSMTDEQIAEIYAVAREAFGGGQRAIQMQSMPFHMTAENLAKYRFDPNMKFWKQIKQGADQFEVSKEETKVAVCAGRYVFGQTPATVGARLDAAGPCPAMQEDATLKSEVAEKEHHDEVEVAALVAKGVQPVRTVYVDGGQNAEFANKVSELSRPEAIAEGPREVLIDSKGRAIKTETKLASVKPTKGGKANLVAQNAPSVVAKAEAPAPANVTAFAPTRAAVGDRPFYENLFGLGKKAEVASAQPLVVPVEPPAPTIVATPAASARKPASPAAKPETAASKKQKKEVVGAATQNFRAYASIER